MRRTSSKRALGIVSFLSDESRSSRYTATSRGIPYSTPALCLPIPDYLVGCPLPSSKARCFLRRLASSITTTPTWHGSPRARNSLAVGRGGEVRRPRTRAWDNAVLTHLGQAQRQGRRWAALGRRGEAFSQSKKASACAAAGELRQEANCYGGSTAVLDRQ